MPNPARTPTGTKRGLILALFSATSALLMASAFVHCGDDKGTGDGGQDGTVETGLDEGGSTDDAGCAPFCNNGNCLNLGSACTANSDCCSQTCNGGVCDWPKCTSDNQSCMTNAECCGKNCTSGNCVPLNPLCRTLGNTCMTNGQCCSQLCKAGICSPSSFCSQQGDVCSMHGDCCSGNCLKGMNQQLGICGDAPTGSSNCKLLSGMVCGGQVPDGGFALNEAGLPICGGGCCSRNCSPWGPTQMLVCQPASGCHVVGDLCQQDKDCCGSAGLPGGSGKPVTCDKTGNFPLGICRNPMGCKPNGDICRLATMSCNASCDCCAGNCQNKDTCHQDIIGVPRCSFPCDGGVPMVNQPCASSADCCGYPCVPNPNYTPDSGLSPLTCSPQKCQQCTQACTINADCCPGMGCIIMNGSTSGTCGPCQDGGKPPCSTCGQLCTQSADCCNGIPCNNGRCECIPPT